MRRVPTRGIVGEVALREAAAGELSAIMGLVRAALRQAIYPDNPDVWIDLEAIYADRAVVRRDGRLYSYPYAITDDNQVSLGSAQEVVLDHKPVTMREAQGAFLEAQDEQGLKWRVRVIRAGLSGNNNYYPDAVLREALPLFEGARVFAKSDDEHLRGKGKSFGQLIGRIGNAAFVEGKQLDSGDIQADLELLASAGEVPAKMLEAYQRGMADLFGFSVDVTGAVKAQRGRRVATKFTRVNSVDLIIEPGAGGQLINLIEALQPEESAEMKLRERMIEAVKKAHQGVLPEGLDANDDEALEVAYREALNTHAHDDAAGTPEAKKPAAAAGAGAPAAAAPGTVTREDLDATVRMVEARAHARVAIAECNLPAKAKEKLHKHFGALERFTEAQVDEAVKAEREYLAALTPSGRVQGVGDTAFIESGEDRADKVAAMLDGFFDPANREVRSFRECYIEITGDRRVTGSLRDCDQARMRESLGGFREALNSASWADVLGDSITRRMIADYNTPNQYDVWREAANVVNVNDFRTQERTRYGGYGDLPAVDEDGAYAPLTSPTDEAASYAVTKRGGLETISLEMIKNDDVGAIQRIPMKLSRSAKRTLAKFVLDFFRTNPTIYDAVAFFHATHGNLGAAALDATTLAAGRLAMLQQTELDSADRLGIGPRSLWVPGELEETAADLFRRSTENDKTFLQSLALQVIPVWYWTDANDWVVTADKDDIATIEIGFLDGNEEPELFVQDSPTQGSLFSNDQIKYKIRHIYGGNVTDFRGAYKAVVA